MPSTIRAQLTSHAAALQARIAELETQLAQNRELVSSMQNIEALVRRHLTDLGFGVGLFTADLRRLDYLSPSAERILGCTRAQLAANPMLWMQPIDAHDAPRVQEALAAALAGGDAEVSYRVRRDAATRRIRAIFAWPEFGQSPVPGHSFRGRHGSHARRGSLAQAKPNTGGSSRPPTRESF